MKLMRSQGGGPSTGTMFLGLVLGAMAAVPSLAAEKKLSDEAQLSFVKTGGNTEVTSLAASNAMTYVATDRLTGTWKLAALLGENSGEKNAESYSTDLRLDYLLSDRFFSYAGAGWMKNTFAGVDRRYQVGAGAGYRFLAGPEHFLTGEIGLTYSDEATTDGLDRGYAGARGFGEYRFAFTEKNSFAQSLEYLRDFEGSDNYALKSETALVSSLGGAFSLKAGYTVTYDNTPSPSTLEKTDSLVSVAIVVSY